MQYHLNGFRAGDPNVKPAAAPHTGPEDEVDVLIVGCGPAGLTLAAQLSEFGDIKTKIVEQKSGPMEKGQADGVSCRSMEMFEALGFAHKVMREAYWVNQTVFWSPDSENPATIQRAGRIQDVEDGLSEMPHVILNQARIHDMFLDHMRHAPAQLVPDYGLSFVDLEIDADGSHPVEVTLTNKTGETQKIRARYVVGCDGARSKVRTSIGRQLHGDSANQVWGVMDILAVTDFPDIRFKAVVQSQDAGTILVIPREGGHMVRLYIEQGTLAPDQRASDLGITAEQLIEKAQAVFHPYSLDVKDVVWWSAYQIGQRLTDKFDDVPTEAETDRTPRVFIAGDACHTHSPKAGQGMNVSMGDAFNLGWKLKSVLRGECDAGILNSYSAERQAVAQDLIDFDKHWAQAIRDQGAQSENDMPPVQRQFMRQGRYTAGVAVRYSPSLLTGSDDWQHLATGFEIGSRFHSAPVFRLADAKRVELGHTILADGRWRMFVFAPSDTVAKDGAIFRLCDFLMEDKQSPLLKFKTHSDDIDARIDLRLVLQAPWTTIDTSALPDLARPSKGIFQLRDYEKTFCALENQNEDIFALRGIDREKGCIVIVRPDQYVSAVLPVDAHAALAEFYDAFMIKPKT